MEKTYIIDQGVSEDDETKEVYGGASVFFENSNPWQIVPGIEKLK